MTRLNSEKAATVAGADGACGDIRSIVIVPKIDDDEAFENFFASEKNSEKCKLDERVVDISDFDSIKSTQRLVNKRAIQGPKGRRKARNPVKSLAARTDLISEYTENKTDVAEREVRRIKAERIFGQSHLAAEAIAGLASSEDFKSVTLRSASLPLNQILLPYKPLMLLHVKGRSHVQTRLVAPTYKSLNRGDCFVLIAGDQLYRYVGEFANVIEQARSKKICAYILENKDLDCKANEEIVLKDNGSDYYERNWRQFWQLLDKPNDYKIPDCGNDMEDELFEASLIETNRIYEFQDDTLLPLEKYWGCIPKFEMLDAQKVLVFDFGSEMYIWNGKNAPADAKRAAIKLSQEYFNATTSSDYSACYVNPLNYAEMLGLRDSPSSSVAFKELKNYSEQRGDWCILGKITQNMETVLFKEKFADWPEVEREDLEKDYLVNGVHAVRALDGAQLYKGTPYEEPNLVLENANLGRGHFYYDNDTMRHFEIITKSINKWLINEFNYDEVTSPENFAHFYSAESYIVRWIYQISVTVRELSGKISNRSTVGRERCVYFCWQGSDASANEKGAAALLTVELDKEKGAQMRVTQGDETAAFVRLFKPMWQHMGSKHECQERRSHWRLYQLLGNQASETILREVLCAASSLRSRASMLLVNGAEGLVFIWHGCQSAPHTRHVAEEAAASLIAQKSSEMFLLEAETLRLEKCEEGSENEELAQALGLTTEVAASPQHRLIIYGSLLPFCDNNDDDHHKTKDYNYTPRLFQFSSTAGGVFNALEIQFPLRCKDLHSPYPFTQAQLYGARQPTIFMFDDSNRLWLWMGWWPVEDGALQSSISSEQHEITASDNRAGVNRWIAERRAALETAVSYWCAKFGDNPVEKFHGIDGYVVWAGLEPIDFKTLFPFWYEREDVKEINVLDGRTPEPKTIVDVLTQLTQTEYPLDVLKQRPLPEGVDPTRLELYLNANEFELALAITQEEFNKLPIWKQTKLKKERGLF